LPTDSLHQPVLLQEAVEGLNINPAGVYIDATFGRGGHTKEILRQLSNKGRLLAIDRDPAAVEEAQSLGEADERLVVRHGAFGEIAKTVIESGFKAGTVDGVLFDLGVSSPQLDESQRGFSFIHDGPLDMRMDPTCGDSAEQWINSASEKEISDVLFKYGEERHARRMARQLIQERSEQPITNTGRLAEIIKQANPSWEKDKHPATRAFQAIRIFINDELGELEKGLQQTLEILRPGGRMVVISFHSLEDRKVKRFIATQSRGDGFPRDLPVTQSMLSPTVKSVGKAIKPGRDEITGNPRSRSAVMRVAEKL